MAFFWHRQLAAIEAKIVNLKKVPTDDDIADIFTKPRVGPKFVFLRARLLGLTHALPRLGTDLDP